MLYFEAKPEHTSEGALSSIISVQGKYIVTRCQSKYGLNVIIKQLPRDPFSRFFVTEGQFDLREIQFYTKVRDKVIESDFRVRVNFNLLSVSADARFKEIQ